MKKIIYGLFLLLNIFTFSNAFACSCLEISEKEALEQSTKAFAGEVLEIEETTLGTNIVKLQVHLWWKGGTESEVTLEIPTDSCAPNLVVGGTYMIYAKGKPLTTSLCSKTREIQSIADIEKVIGVGRKVVK